MSEHVSDVIGEKAFDDVAAFAWQRRPVARVTCSQALLHVTRASTLLNVFMRERVGVAKQTPLCRDQANYVHALLFLL